MKSIDWSSFTRREYYKTDIETVFNAWASQESIESWFLEIAIFFDVKGIKGQNQKVEKGNVFKWSWYGSDMVGEGEILEIIPNEKISFTFLECRVDLHFSNDGVETKLELVQSEIPIDEISKIKIYVEWTSGWTFYLTNLKSILEGGIDLRNKNPNFKREMNI